MKFLAKILGGENPLKNVADVVDRFVDTKDDKREFFKEVYQMQAEDRNGARNMYSQDSLVQKIFALVFLAAYVAISAFMIYWSFNHSELSLSDFQITMISSTFGAMSAKVSTITDFFFGAAEEKRKTNYDQLIGKKDK